MAERPQIARRNSFNRSRVTNGSRVLPGVDGRSIGARRFRDLLNALLAELPEPTTAEMMQARSAATLQVHAEALAAREAMGEAVDSETLIRAANAAQRAVQRLRRASRGREGQNPAKALHDRLRARGEAA